MIDLAPLHRAADIAARGERVELVPDQGWLEQVIIELEAGRGLRPLSDVGPMDAPSPELIRVTRR